MKTFKDYIIEEGGAQIPTDSSVFFQGSAGLSSNHIPHDIEDADVKGAINAVLGHVAVAEFLNPKAAIAQMEAKLAQLGLNRLNVPSSDPRNESPDVEFGESGNIQLSFSRYGEITGKSVDTPIDELDKEEYTVDLNVKYEQLESGTYKVYGSLA